MNQLHPKICGTGRALPMLRNATSKIEVSLKLTPNTLYDSTGVEARYVCTNETQIDLAVNAANAALSDANINASDINLIIFASAVPYQNIPSTAPLIQQLLNISDGTAMAFDVNSTCLSFVTGLEIASTMMRSNSSQNALVISSEIASRALPWKAAPEVAALFGDGAAAAVLMYDDAFHFRAHHMKTFPSQYDACSLVAGGTRIDYHANSDIFYENSFFQMDGRALFALTARHFNNFIDELLEKAGWKKEDVDLIIPHQASPHALEHLVRITNFHPDKIINHATEYGNQIAASIPFMLDIARKSGRVSSGAKVLMLGTSAGVSFGGIAYEC